MVLDRIDRKQLRRDGIVRDNSVEHEHQDVSIKLGFVTDWLVKDKAKTIKSQANEFLPSMRVVSRLGKCYLIG